MKLRGSVPNKGKKDSDLTRLRKSVNSQYWSGKKRVKGLEKMKAHLASLADRQRGKSGHKMSLKTRQKQRLSALERLGRSIQLIPNFNSFACLAIDEFGRQNGYTFQHALNGGEFFIKELGYWVDGYDKEKNCRNRILRVIP